MSTSFFLIFLITIVVTRLFLFLRPIPAPTIERFRMHHYMFGILGIILSLILRSPLIFAIGLGLFVDELTYILIGGKTHKDNYSKVSLAGTLLFVIMVFILKDYLLYIFK